MIKARASGSKVYLYFMKKGRQATHRIPRNSCFIKGDKIYNFLYVALSEESFQKGFAHKGKNLLIPCLLDLIPIEKGGKT